MIGLYRRFFSYLVDSNVNLEYCILDRKEDLTNKKFGDLDICVSSVREFERLLRRRSVKIVQKLEHHYGAVNFFVLFEDKLLSLDLYELFVVDHRLVFPGSFFLSNRILDDNLYFLSKEAWCKYYLVKKIVKKQTLEKMNLADIISAIQKDPHLSELKEEILGLKAKFSQEAILKVRDKLLKQYPICLQSVIYEPLRIFKRLLKPTGKVVAFLGPDGAGKSTIIKALMEDKTLPFRRVAYFHLMPRVIRRKRHSRQVHNPHAKSPYIGLKAYVKLAYFILEYFLGYYLKVYPMKVKSTLVLFDRYYDDLLVDPFRYRYGGNLEIAHFLRKFIPKPDLYIVVLADPEEIYLRKQEVTFSELKRQLESYDKLCANGNRKCFKILTNKPLKFVLKDIRCALFSLMERRWE